MKRPRSVTIIGSLLLLQGLALSVFPGLFIGFYVAGQFDLLPQNLVTEPSNQMLPDLLVAATALIIGVFGVVGSIGLLRLRAWGWLMVMIIQGIIMIINLVDYTRGDAGYFTYLAMVFSVVTVLYLNQRDLRHVFDVVDYQANRPANPAPPDQSTTMAPAELNRDLAQQKEGVYGGDHLT